MSGKGSAIPVKNPRTRQPKKAAHETETPSEIALDVANELSFPASDPVSASNITRIETAPETAPAAKEHQSSNLFDAAEAAGAAHHPAPPKKNHKPRHKAPHKH
jgi:protease I